jgi:hypothetical protein
MKTKKVPHEEQPADPFQQHHDAWRCLSEELTNYRQVLAPDLESIQSAKTLAIATAEETSDLEKLDQLSIRIRSLEIREQAVSQKAETSEKSPC